MAFFGINDITGISSTFSIENAIFAYRASPSSNGIADSISVYLDWANTLSGLCSVKCALYTDVADPVLIAETEEREFDTASITDAWETFNFTGGGPSLTAGTNYLIAVWAESGSWELRVRVNSSGGNGIEADTSETYTPPDPAFPDPLVNSPLANYKMAIYCTYTESASARLLASTGVGT